ncbi:hypothetical protein ACJ41O_012853 [Fusarium nematophilum]
MVDVSNARPIGILVGYLIAATAVTARCISIVGRSQGRAARGRRNAIIVFSALAAVSLATTWYHMFCYFQWSYLQWASLRVGSPGLEDHGRLYLGQWLRDTSLFKEAWVSTLTTPFRAWWSLQIFGFCAIWSIMLAAQAHKRRVPRLWLFMLLGQIVAISFAANLSFLAFTVYDVVGPSPADDRTPKAGQTKSTKPNSSSRLPLGWLVILGVNLVCAISIPGNIHHPRFLYLLLLPHTLAFVPLLLNSILAAPAPSSLSRQPPASAQFATMVTLVLTATLNVANDGGDWGRVAETLYEHPAVSSVGWDVICCWVSFTAWTILGSV